jgi:hypothetical protein
MTFRDELKRQVVSVRETVKNNAIVAFVDFLKSEMGNSAKEGRTSGGILLEVLVEDEYEAIFCKLKEILLITGEITDSESDEWFSWLLETIKETNIFEGISMNIDRKNGCLDWYLE